MLRVSNENGAGQEGKAREKFLILELYFLVERAVQRPETILWLCHLGRHDPLRLPSSVCRGLGTHSKLSLGLLYQLDSWKHNMGVTWEPLNAEIKGDFRPKLSFKF